MSICRRYSKFNRTSSLVLEYGLSKFLNGGSGCVLILCECTNTLPYRTPIATQANPILNLGKCIRIGA